MGPNDFPDYVHELGICGADPIDAPRPERCGCVTSDLWHDVEDCLVAQADALQDDERERAERRAGWIR